MGRPAASAAAVGGIVSFETKKMFRRVAGPQDGRTPLIEQFGRWRHGGCSRVDQGFTIESATRACGRISRPTTSAFDASARVSQLKCITNVTRLERIDGGSLCSGENMTSVTYRNTPSLSVPQTQNTAPVFEHACLFTHDIKRKQKRWQDGSLKYHTFNRRIMVFDMAGNRVGDTHWTSSVGIQEGDEVTLEKWGVLVEVSERTGKTQTDLSELRNAQNRSSARPPVQTPIRRTGQAHSSGQESSHLKHRSLNSLLGSNRMMHGKPRPPPESPFEHRQKESAGQDWADDRPSKRQRVQPNPPPAPTRTVVAPAANPLRQSCPKHNGAQSRNLDYSTTPVQNRPSNSKNVIDLCDDDDDNDDFDDSWKDLLSDSPMAQAQKDGNGFPITKAVSTTSYRRKAGLPEQPRRNANGLVDKDGGKSGNTKCAEAASVPKPSIPAIPAQISKPHRAPATKNLPAAQDIAGTTSSIVTSKPRKKRTLLCQHQLVKDMVPEVHVRRDADLASAASKLDNEDSRSRTVEAKLEARLARIREKDEREAKASLKVQSDALESDEEFGLSDFMNHSDDDDALSSRHDSATELKRLDDRVLPPTTVKAKEAKLPEKRAVQPDLNLVTLPPPAESPGAVHQEKRPKESSNLPMANPDLITADAVEAPQPPRKAATTTSDITKISGAPAPVPAARAAAKPTETPAPRGFQAMKQSHNPVHLKTAATGVSSVILSKSFKAPAAPAAARAPVETMPQDLGPWSREAFDLFVWRPPEWDEENWCVKSKEESAVDSSVNALAK